MTLTELQALPDEELDIAVARRQGHVVVVWGRDDLGQECWLYKLDANSSGHWTYSDLSEEDCWEKGTDPYSTSLSACAPLLDEMGTGAYASGVELRCDREYSWLTVPGLDPLFAKGSPSEAWPRLICIAYILWKQEQA